MMILKFFTGFQNKIFRIAKVDCYILILYWLLKQNLPYLQGWLLNCYVVE